MRWLLLIVMACTSLSATESLAQMATRLRRVAAVERMKARESKLTAADKVQRDQVAKRAHAAQRERVAERAKAAQPRHRTAKPIAKTPHERAAVVATVRHANPARPKKPAPDAKKKETKKGSK